MVDEVSPTTGPESPNPGVADLGKPKEIKHPPIFVNMGLDPN